MYRKWQEQTIGTCTGQWSQHEFQPTVLNAISLCTVLHQAHSKSTKCYDCRHCDWM